MGATKDDATNDKGQYVFSSSPTLPREKTPDILIKFKAISSEQPSVLSKPFYLSSRSTLAEVRRKIHSTFAPYFEKGFIFLHKNREVRRSHERIISVFEILPKAPNALGQDLNPSFVFQDVQYKKISFEKDGRRFWSRCIGLVYLFENSGLKQWSPEDLKAALSGEVTDAFSFIPFAINSYFPDNSDVPVDQLNCAASRGDTAILRDILHKLPNEADARTLRDYRQATPLHYAAQSGQLDVCELLIGQFGRSLIYMKDMNKRTPLHCALNFNKLDVVVYLLQLDPDLDCQDVHGLSCRQILYTLSNKSTLYILPRLDPGLLDETLVLHFTCYTIQLKMKQLAKIYCQHVIPFESSFYRPPLHLAAELGDEEIIKILLKENMSEQKSTDDNKTITSAQDQGDKDPDGHLPFHYACQHGHANIVPLLYFKNMTNDDFVKGIHLAVSWKRYEVLKLLPTLRETFQITNTTKELLIKEAESDFSNLAMYHIPFLKNEKHLLNRFLSQAAYHGDTEMMKWLLDQGVEIDLKDFMGRTALHEAVQSNHDESVKMLLEKGANPNIGDWQKSTPLHYACYLGHQKTVMLLLKCDSINPALQDSSGKTPVMVAAKRKHDKLMDYLIQNHLEQMNPKAADVSGHTLLYYIPLLHEKTAESLIKRISTISEQPIISAKEEKNSQVVNLTEIWADLSQISPDTPCPVIRKPKTNSITATLKKCTVCSKTWTEFGNRQRKVHYCRVGNKEGKLVMLSKEDSFVICQIITQPFQRFSSVQITHDTPCPVIRKPKKNSITATLKKCRVCSKTWTEFGNRQRNIHYCRVGNEEGKLVTLSKENNVSISHIITQPFQRFSSIQSDDVSLLRQLIMHDRPELIHKIAVYLPDIFQKEFKSAAIVAAKYWSEKSLISLDKCHSFTEKQLDLLLQVAILNETFSDKDKTKQANTVKQLIEMGASPNYIPTDLEKYKDFSFSEKEKHLLVHSALELAVLKENERLVDVLLSNKASTLICFALHLAVWKGNTEILSTVISHWKSQSLESTGPADEHARVCAKGVFQAAVNSPHKSEELFSVIIRLCPELLQSKSLLTQKMVSETRQLLNAVDSPVNTFTFRLESMLPLTHFIQHISQYEESMEAVVCQLIETGVHLANTQITKHSSVHCVCQAFISAVQNKLWKVVIMLLRHGGSVMWNCLLSANTPCHKHVYFQYQKVPLPILSAFWQSFFQSAPLEIQIYFFQEGHTFLKTVDIGDLEKIIMEISTTHERKTTALDILQQIAWHHFTKSSTKMQHVMASKLLYIFPRLFTKYILMIHQYLCTWIMTQNRSERAKIFKSNYNLRARRACQILQKSTKEASLITTLSKLTTTDLEYIKKMEISMLQFASAVGDYDLAESCLSAVDALPVDCRGKDDVTPLSIAAAAGNIKMVDLFLQHGHTLEQQTLNAACCGKQFLKMPYIKSVTATQGEKGKLTILKKLESSSKEIFWEDHRDNGTVFKMAVTKTYWQIVEYLLKNELYQTHMKSHPKELIKLITEAPSTLGTLLLSKYKSDILDVMKNGDGEMLTSVCRVRSDDIVNSLLNVLLENSEMCTKLADQMSYSDMHNMTAIHYLCQKGKSQTMILILSKLGENGYKSVKTILNMKDKSGATPLWYAMANRHWNIAENLILSGGGLHTRPVPDWKPKRKFIICKKEGETRRLVNASRNNWKRSDSRQIASLISPHSKTFNIYLHPPKQVTKSLTPQITITQMKSEEDTQTVALRKKVQYLLSS